MSSASFSIDGKKALVEFIASRTFFASLHDRKMNEISGPGYDKGGVLLKNPRTTMDAESASLTWDNPSWSNASFTGARFLRIYDAGSSTTYGVIDFGADKSGQGADFIYKFPRSGGVIRL
jgi:hypothetical protein